MGVEVHASHAKRAFQRILTAAELSRFSWQPEQDEQYGGRWPVVGSQYFSGIGHLWLVYDSKKNAGGLIQATYVATIPVRENKAVDFLNTNDGLKTVYKHNVFHCWGTRHSPGGRGQMIIVVHGDVQPENPLPARVIAETDEMLRQYLRPDKRVHFA